MLTACAGFAADFNGHEHDLEHIVEPGSKVNYICTGAGRYCCYKDGNLKTVPEGSIKFAMSGRGGQDWWGRRPPNFELLAGFVSDAIPCPRLARPCSSLPACLPACFAIVGPMHARF